MKKTLTLMVVCAILCSLTLVSSAQNPSGNRQRGQGAPGGFAGQQGPVKAEGAIDLLASKNLDDWDFFLNDGAKKEDIWSFTEEGTLYCKGVPMGYLCTKKDYRDFKLTVQWRWPEGVEPTNSGILMRINGQPKALPRCVEAQLAFGNAGDIWTFHNMELEGYDKARFTHNTPGRVLTGEARGVKKLVNAERPAGRWNTYEILCQDETLVISVNGTIVNWTKDLEDVAGKIAFQSEGGPIEFRNAVLTPLNRTDD